MSRAYLGMAVGAAIPAFIIAGLYFFPNLLLGLVMVAGFAVVTLCCAICGLVFTSEVLGFREEAERVADTIFKVLDRILPDERKPR